MKRIILSLAAVLLLIPLPPVFAACNTTEIKPDDHDQNSFKFSITAKAVADGMIQFHIVVTEKQLTFTHPDTSLSIVMITKLSEEIKGVRALAQEKKDKSITCDFTVSEKSLGDPNLSFVFVNYVEEVIDGKVMPAPSCDIFYARLKDYYKKQP